LGYYQQAGIWQPNSGKNTGMVVARIEIDYLAPIFLGQHLQVRLTVSRIGTKSLTFEFQFEVVPEGVVCARGKSIMVTYDSDKGESIPVPEEWREKINKLEAQKEHDETA
jgi:acyl-CoA thioester hydrolase